MYSEEELKVLREEVKSRLSEKRFRHTLGVEKMAEQLGKFCLKDKIPSLRAAALLHDIAKELSIDEQIDLIKCGRIKLTEEELSSHPTLHSFASVYLIKRDFPKFSEKNILDACKNHTVGSPRMSIFEEIIFLSDYIEEGRKYEDSKEARRELLSSLGENRARNLKALHKATLSSLNRTLSHLESKDSKVNPKTVLTKNAFSSKI